MTELSPLFLTPDKPKPVHRRHARRCPFYRGDGWPCCVAAMFSDSDSCTKRPCMVHQTHAYTSRKYARTTTNEREPIKEGEQH